MTEKNATTEPKAPKAPEHSGGDENMGKAERMKRSLEAQPKVTIMIPLLPGEAEGSNETVILNGYRTNIRKGSYVQVPEQVARVIMESQQQTQEAIQNYFLMNAEGKSKAMQAKEIKS